MISFWILFDLKYSLYLSANLLLAQQEHFFDHCQKGPSLPLSLSLTDRPILLQILYQGCRSKTRTCFLYLNISMMKMEILTSRKFDKILISLKMFTFLNNLYFLLLCCKNFFVLQKIFSQWRSLWTVQFPSRSIKSSKHVNIWKWKFA